MERQRLITTRYINRNYKPPVFDLDKQDNNKVNK